MAKAARITPGLLAYTIEQAAIALSCSHRTVRRMVADGHIRTFRLGERRSIRIPVSEIQRIIDGGSEIHEPKIDD